MADSRVLEAGHRRDHAELRQLHVEEIDLLADVFARLEALESDRARLRAEVESLRDQLAAVLGRALVP